MGKSVRQTSDPFAFKPEYNNQVGTAIPKPVENDPFAFKPEYNTQVKKNGGDGGLGTSSPTQLQSGSELPKETATDFLTKDIDANDFVSKAVSNTDIFFPETAIKRRNQEIAQQTKTEVFSNPTKLAQYAADRITTLKEKVKSLKTQQSQLTSLGEPGEGEAFGAFSGQSIISDKKKYNEINQQILDTSNYIHKLKNNVADIASDFIVSQEDPKTLNPKSVGRKIVSIADPDLDEQMKVIEKAGGVLPGIRAEELERIGLSATKNYLSRQPNVPQKEQLLNLVNSYENDFEERNYLTTAMRVREKIGAQIYKDGNQVRGAWFGLGYPNWQLKEIIENPQTGLTDSERKVALNYVLPLERKIIGTDIPTSGFTKSFYSAIEKAAIGTGKSLGDISGIRTEADIASDLLSQEADQSRYRAPGEGPTPQAQLAYLNQKGKLTEPEIKQKKELENYVNVRSGWSKFKDGVGDLTGQVAQMVLLTKGLGAGGKLLQAVGAEGGLMGGLATGTIGTALSTDAVGLVVNGFLNSYDNYKQQALSLMPGESKAGERDAYAKTMATVEGLSEMIFPDTKVLKAFTSKLAPAVKDITSKLISQEITQQVAKEEFQSAMSQYLKPFAKEFAKSELQESTEEAVVDLAQGVADSVFGGQQFDISKTGNQALNTFFTTMLYSPLVSGMAAHGAHRQNQSQNAFAKSAMVDMASNPAAYLKAVEDLQLSGEITQAQANEKVKIIKSANNYLQEIPSSRLVTTKTGEGEQAQTSQQNKPMDFPEVSSYLLHRLNEGILQQQIDNSTDEVLKSKLEKDVKRSQEIRKGIFDGSIGVTPDLQDITDNPKKSEELGIADAEQALPEQLIGTPFQKPADENIQPAPAEGQPKAAESEATAQAQTGEDQKKAIAPTLNAEQQKEAADFANELIGEKIIPDVYHNMITKENANPFWKMVAQQAQNVDANWVPLEGDENVSEQAAIDAFGETVVDYAKELFPAQPTQALTKDAVDLLASIGEGSQPTFITKNLERIAKENGVEVTDKMTAADVINALKEKRQPISSQQNTKSNESKISQEANAQKGGEEIGQETGNADEAGNEILNDQGAEPEVAASLTEAETIAQKGKILANRIRSLKTRRDVAQANIFGIGVSLYDTSLDIIAFAIEQGATLATAIARGIEYIKTNHGEALSEDEYTKHIEDASNRLRIKTKEELTDFLNELNQRYADDPRAKVYRFVDFNAAVQQAELSEEEIESAVRKSKIDSRDKNKVVESISGKGKRIAQKIRELKSPRNLAQANIFGIAIGIYDGALEVVATAVEQGAKLADAINQGIQYVRETGSKKFDEDGFRQHLEDQVEGKKPKIRVQVGEPTASGITHAQTEETRQEFGLGDSYEKTIVTDKELNDQADVEIRKGYDIDKLVSKLEELNDPTPLETVILKKYKGSLEAEIKKNPTDEKLNELNRLVQASDKIGSQQARSFRLRQGMEFRDDSLAGFFIQDINANLQAPLTDQQKETVIKEHEAIANAQAKYDAKIEALEAENARLRAEKAIKKEKPAAKKEKKTHEDYAQERKSYIDAAKEKLKKLRGQSQITIVPYANELFAIAPEVAKVVKSLVAEGVNNLAEITKNIYDTFKEIVPNLTEADVNNIIAGEYGEKQKTKSEIAETMRDLRDEAALINKLDALLSGEVTKNERKNIARNQQIEQLRQKIKELKSAQGKTESEKLASLKSRTKSEIAKLEEQLKTGNFAKEEKSDPIKLDKEATELKDKLIKLRQERLVRLIKQEYASRSKFRRVIDAAANVLNVPRSLMASIDFSAPLRQAAIVTVANPVTAAMAGLEMFKQAFSQKRFDRWFYDLQETPRYSLMQQSGLYVADPHDPRLSAKEEQFMSNLAEKIPIIGKLVKGSERAYVSYLNKMRVDLFNRYTDALENDGFTWENHPEMYKGLSSFLNNSTGRGELGPLEVAAPILNSAFFSPRLMASRINILGLNPTYYAKLPPKIRYEALKSLAIFIGAGVTTIALLSLSFGCKDDDKDKDCLHVETDPRSSDFGKVISDKTRWDIWGGFQQYVRLVAQLATGQAKSVSSGKINDLDGEGLFKRTRADQLFAFFRGKLAPVPSFVVDRLAGRNVIGQKQTLAEASLSRIIPLVVSDLYSSIKESGVKAIFTQGIPATFGVGVQNYLPQGYDNKNMKDPVFKFLYDKNLSLHEPAKKKEMSDEQYSQFLKDRSAIIKEEWQQAIQYGIMLNEKGNPTIDQDAAVKIVPADKATYEQLTGLMKSITAKATRDVHKQAAEQ